MFYFGTVHHSSYSFFLYCGQRSSLLLDLSLRQCNGQCTRLVRGGELVGVCGVRMSAGKAGLVGGEQLVRTF